MSTRWLRRREFLLGASLAISAALQVDVVRPCEANYPIWIPRYGSADPYYRFIRDERIGYIDRTGRVVIQPRLTTLSYGGYEDEFHDGLLLTRSGTYVDLAGHPVIQEKVYGSWPFCEGLAPACQRLGGNVKWGFLDTTGAFAIPPKFDAVTQFSERLSAVVIEGRYGYIDQSGAFVIAPSIAHAEAFHDGIARAVMEGPCEFRTYYWDPCLQISTVGEPDRPSRPDVRYPYCDVTYIDKSGHPISTETYQSAKEFSEGLAPVVIDEKWGFIDQSGRLVITPAFDEAWPFSEGLARVGLKRRYGYIDRYGEQVITTQFEYAEEFSNGRAVVGELGGAYWYINKQGTPAIAGKFQLASPFFKGLAHVKYIEQGRSDFIKGRYGYIDTEGKLIFSYKR